MITAAFQNIIYRYFRGKLADEEYQIMTDSLQDPEFREYFEQAKQEWTLNPEVDETGKKNWIRLEYNMNKKKTTLIPIPYSRRPGFRIASVAAILVLGLFCGSVVTYFLSGNKVKSEQLVFETPRGEKSLVKLPDGSQVWLNANSRLIYNSFSADHRQVELKGEAFFRVAHHEKAPFVVKTNECSVEVLGTTFNVMAYDAFGRKEITLLTGKVNVQMGGMEQVLKPGQTLILKDHKVRIVEVDASKSSAWVDNKFNFQNLPLSELMQRLENWYDVDIKLENNSGREVNFTGTFKNEETIWQVLDAIKVYTPIKYDKTDLRRIHVAIE